MYDIIIKVIEVAFFIVAIPGTVGVLTICVRESSRGEI